MFQLDQLDKLNWLYKGNIRPYVFLREEHHLKSPGSFRGLSDWFSLDPIFFNPFKMADVPFADSILSLESQAFKVNQMITSRWVFYDCGLMPGLVVGFAYETAQLPESLRAVLKVNEDLKWTPISLFIIIPSMSPREWVAHNLCSANVLLEKEDRYYGLGFLTKAFGLWHANINTCCGMTQWGSPAMSLHSYYGELEILTAYTPIHNYPKTFTYRFKVNVNYWEHFFTGKPRDEFEQKYHRLGFGVDPLSDSSCMDLQTRIERGEGPFYLRPLDIKNWSSGQMLSIYKLS